MCAGRQNHVWKIRRWKESEKKKGKKEKLANQVPAPKTRKNPTVYIYIICMYMRLFILQPAPLHCPIDLSKAQNKSFLDTFAAVNSLFSIISCDISLNE